MKFHTKLYKVGYPLYGAKFVCDDQFVVTGGGGEGNNGVDNKLTVLKVGSSEGNGLRVDEVCDATLPANDDSPTALDAVGDTILIGCNENSAKVKSGAGNSHVRKFRYDGKSLKFESAADIDKSTNPEDYTKVIRLSKDGSEAAIASSKNPPSMAIIDPRNYSVKYEIETGRDVKDLHFSPNGKLIGYITESSLEIISTVTGSCVVRKTDFDRKIILSKMKFLDDNNVLIAATWASSKGILLTKISIKSGKTTVFWSRQITSKFKGITAMDVNDQMNLVMLATNDNSVLLVKLRNLSVGKTFTQVHGFAITRVIFSPDSRYAVSISAAETVHVIEIPSDFADSRSLSESTTQWLMNTIMVLFLAFVLNSMYKEDMHKNVLNYFRSVKSIDSSSILSMEDMEQVTLVGTISTSVRSTTQRFESSKSVSSTSVVASTNVSEKERSQQDQVKKSPEQHQQNQQ